VALAETLLADDLAVTVLSFCDVDGDNWTEPLEGPLVWTPAFNGVVVKTSIVTVDDLETLLVFVDCFVEAATKTLVVGHLVCIE